MLTAGTAGATTAGGPTCRDPARCRGVAERTWLASLANIIITSSSITSAAATAVTGESAAHRDRHGRSFE